MTGGHCEYRSTMGNRRNARKHDTKKQSRESVERNERRIRRRNEEIKKGGIEIAKKANEKMEKEEEEEKKKDERRRTEDSLGVVCTLIYVAAYISAKGGKNEWRRRTEKERGKEEKGRTERRETRTAPAPGEGRKPRNNWRSGGGRISCCLASAPFKESLAFC